MTISEILDLYKDTAFLPYGMTELLLEREAELVRGSNEVPAPSPLSNKEGVALRANDVRPQGTRDGSAL